MPYTQTLHLLLTFTALHHTVVMKGFKKQSLLKVPSASLSITKVCFCLTSDHIFVLIFNPLGRKWKWIWQGWDSNPQSINCIEPWIDQNMKIWRPKGWKNWINITEQIRESTASYIDKRRFYQEKVFKGEDFSRRRLWQEKDLTGEVELSKVELSWIELNWAKLSWIVLNCLKLFRT